MSTPSSKYDYRNCIHCDCLIADGLYGATCALGYYASSCPMLNQEYKEDKRNSPFVKKVYIKVAYNNGTEMEVELEDCDEIHSKSGSSGDIILPIEYAFKCKCKTLNVKG